MELWHLWYLAMMIVGLAFDGQSLDGQIEVICSREEARENREEAKKSESRNRKAS